MLDLGTIARATGLRPWRCRADLVAYQERCLRRLVAHAHAHVPYYRELLDRHGVAPTSIRGLADLSRIPITTKADLRQRPAGQLLATGLRPERLRRVHTTGSTGEPLLLFRTVGEQLLQRLFWLRAEHALGRRLLGRVARLGVTRPGRIRASLLGRPLRAIGLVQTMLDMRQPPDRLLDELARLRPDLIGSYGGILATLGEALQQRGRTDIRLRLVVVGGEVLTEPRCRQLATSWRAPVLEVYGCWELGLLAWQCRATGALHVCDDSVILEVVRADGRPAASGERGEVVVTGLHLDAMPLIRYRLGDLVTQMAEGCGCGSCFRTLGAVRGRMMDCFVLPGGRLLHPYEILADLAADAFHWVRHYQLVQEAVDRIVFVMVPGPELTPARLAAFIERAGHILGPGIDFSTRLVERIEPGPGGKAHLARSLVPGTGAGDAWLHATPAGG